MIRILFYLVVLGALAYGADWLLQRPGHIELTWAGYHIVTSAAVGLTLIVLAVIALTVLWSLLRFVFGLPSFMVLASRQRRREKGYAALSRGLIAAGAGDARGAVKASTQASKHLKDDPLAMVLKAQAASLAGDGGGAEAAFTELAQRDETRLLGLRGLHDEANRRGDDEAARFFAAEAHQSTPLPWSARTVLAHRAADGDWERALGTVETSIVAKLVDKPTGERQRAVLQTAIGLEKEAVAPDEALALARSAMKRAPDLVPAIVLAARLLTRRGDIRKAAKLIETAWPRCPHPELARAYLDVRPGDSTSDRLARAQTLMRLSSFDPVSRMTVARAALAAKDFVAAREAMAPLIAEGKRPTVRACLIMADLEDAEFGDAGQLREWLARASRAPLDPAWIADGIVYEQWEPVSPTTGRLDAFAWQAPADRPGHAMEAMPAAPPRAELASGGDGVRLNAPAKTDAAALAPPEQPASLADHRDAASPALSPQDDGPAPRPDPAAPIEPVSATASSAAPNASAIAPPEIAPLAIAPPAIAPPAIEPLKIAAKPDAPKVVAHRPRPFMRTVYPKPDGPGAEASRGGEAAVNARREDITTPG